MNEKKYFLLLTLVVFSIRMFAQVPNLPVKTVLSTSLSGTRAFSNATGFDTMVLPFTGASEFTLEVKAKVNSAVGRGLDVQLNKGNNFGFRTSLDKTTFNNTVNLAAIENLSTSIDNAQEQTYRYAVKDGVVHIYQDGHYLTSKTLDYLTDGSTTTQVVEYGADNGLSNWAGFIGNNSGKPSDYGWANTSTSLPWNTANSSGGVRYMDVTSGHTFESDGSTFQGRLMYIRWDGSTYSSSTYSYPIKLEYGYQYEFSWLYEYLANAAAGAKMNVSISKSADGSGALFSKIFTTGSANKIRKGDLTFMSELEGAYYLTITGDYALFGIADLKLKSSNLINTWAGLTNNNTGTPAAYGWKNTYSGIPWNAANTTSGVRYVDVTSGHSYESDGTNFSGRLMYLNWSDPAYQTSVYSFPVTVTGGKSYAFSWIYELLSGTTGNSMTVSVSASENGGTPIATQNFTCGDLNKLRTGQLKFNPTADGTYYITLKGDAASFAIGKLGIKEVMNTASNIVIGKNYADGTVDMVVSSVTYEDKAYAPEKIIAPSVLTLETTSNLNANTFAKSKVVLNSAASLTLKNAYTPLINSTVDLKSYDARIYFQNSTPNDVISSHLTFVSVNGAPAVSNGNVYVLNSGAGSVVIPYIANVPLEVFTEENYGGTSQQYQDIIRYTALGVLDNKIKSFKLKKGHMVTFASNADGTGYSRVFIAEDADLEIPVMPAYLKGTVSFIRAMIWHQVTKKGLAGGSLDERNGTKVSWYYNWNSGSATTPQVEYVPIRQTQYWPGFEAAYTKEGYTHLLGYNEPDRPDQANMTVDQAISGWPGLLASGLRLGSPAPSDPFNGWLPNFLKKADENNYRVDFTAIHCYWYKTAAQWKSDLEYVYNNINGKRPIWITEWNIGANWTGNSFPDGPNLLTDANATKHKNDLVAVLNVLDNLDFVERYSIYNWVQDARAMFVTINDTWKTNNPDWQNYQWLKTAPVIASWTGNYTVLTPAGQYYANNASKKAFNISKEYIPTMTSPKTETLSYVISANNESVKLTWTGINNDLVNKYVLQRKLEGELNFSVFYETTDYTKLNVNDLLYTKTEYRMMVLGKDNRESAYSDVITVINPDVDKDGVMDVVDQCLNTPFGETVNANGCSNGQLDDDKDGVINSLDQCPNTPSGETVNANGCFAVPVNNFAITQVGETCPNKNNGQINIVATSTYNYVATINNVAYNFTDNKLSVSNLAPGSYSVCISISGKTFEQCYTIEIPKSNAITAKAISNSDKLNVTIESGTAPYQVVVNGVVQFETSETNFDVGVIAGDVLEVKTSKICEGSFSKTIALYDAVRAFPNPSSGEFDIYLPTNEDSVSIAIYSVDAKLISIANYQIENGKVHINIDKEPAGVYFVKIQSNPEEVIQIIKK
ncbi:Por secretion system C-terminal sorting domain-containing protein [Flavobacterium glycines]|uniref:Por secretion system C-terminal sorting domain-containing protein n=2 Tax=Flavobacterium glycines TaxID=551990 RepID=A0A1G8LY51_9FLAO|nr:glycosyl hydrolase [Flavobacterium glycines]SDI60644.1 Por secretion system C-terminal sorting domain-containing protein [Flavobacterium glycines]